MRQPYTVFARVCMVVFGILAVRGILFDEIANLFGLSHQVGFGMAQGLETIFFTALTLISWIVARDLKGL